MTAELFWLLLVICVWNRSVAFGVEKINGKPPKRPPCAYSIFPYASMSLTGCSTCGFRLILGYFLITSNP